MAGRLRGWVGGWVGEAQEQESNLAAVTAPYRQRRTAEAAEGRLSVTVRHQDLSALPR